MNRNRTSRPLWPVLLALVLGAGSGAFFWLTRESAPQTPPSHPALAPARSASSPQSGSAPDAPISDREPAVASTTDPTATEAPLLSGEAAIEAISDLSATYDAASVPALARYLKHKDPEIRAAARDGLINLGERAAIPFLAEAAKTAPAEEAQSLREAAEFLALPTWTEHREAQKKARAAQQATGPSA